MKKGVQPGVQYGYRPEAVSDTVFNFFSGLGSVAFAYGGHNVVMEIQATMPSTQDKPSKIPMWKGVVFAYVVIGLCYIPVAVSGYWIFGNAVDENILFSLQQPTWLVAMANMLVVVHLVGGYQINAMPVFDMIEAVLVKKLKFEPNKRLRIISRTSYVGNELQRSCFFFYVIWSICYYKLCEYLRFFQLLQCLWELLCLSLMGCLGFLEDLDLHQTHTL